MGLFRKREAGPDKVKQRTEIINAILKFAENAYGSGLRGEDFIQKVAHAGTPLISEAVESGVFASVEEAMQMLQKEIKARKKIENAVHANPPPPAPQIEPLVPDEVPAVTRLPKELEPERKRIA